MEFDLQTTVIAFVLLIAVGVGTLFAMPAEMGGMATDTILMMVLPSMVIFGAVALLIGLKHGEHRATAR